MGLFSKPVMDVEDIYKNEVFSSYKRFLHVYVVNDEKAFIKLNSFDAKQNASLFDAPIVKEIPKNKNYFEIFLSVYKEYTSKAYKQEKLDKKQVAEPKVMIDPKNKVLVYVLFVKDIDPVDTTMIPQTNFVFDWVSINEFLQIVCSNKFVNYGEGYVDFLVDGISELFNIEEYIKKQKYTSNQE